MLSKEDNELLCRVGPGTPMGDVMRQYWMPAMLSSELPAAEEDMAAAAITTATVVEVTSESFIGCP